MILLHAHNFTVIIFLSLTVLTCLCAVYYLSAVSAAIIPFPRQEIKDGIQEGVFSNASIVSQISPKPTVSIAENNPLDILGVSHFSDGKTLNATMWLDGVAIKDPLRFDIKELEYGVLVDTDNRIGTGKFDVDFQKQIKWTPNGDNITSALVEYSSSGLHKALVDRENVPNFKENSYFPVSIDLDSVTSPSKFRVAYYTIVTTADNQKIIDITSWIDVPPAEFSLLPSTNPLVLTQGETVDIGVQLVSNTGTSPRVLNYTSEQTHHSVEVKFNPNSLNFSSFQTGPEPFRISVPKDTEVGSYVIPIRGNVSLESVKLGLPSINASILGQSYFTIRPNLSITVITPPSFGDQFKEFWASYGQVISLFGAGFVGGFSTHIVDIIKQRSKERKKQR